MLCLLFIAAAFVPGSDSQVLEQVPRRDDPQLREVRALSGALQKDPQDATLAVKAARTFLEHGRDDGDPRWSGRAESALQPWWDAPQPPEEILVLRAILRQNVHDFPAALADLDQAVQEAPKDAQAWLTRASVQQVRGDYAGARVSCGPLVRLARPLVAAACLAGVASLSGSLPAARAYLKHVLSQDNGDEPPVTRWALTLLAEMAHRAGQDDEAAAEYARARVVGAPDAYLLASFSDFLLDTGKPAQVVALLAERTRADALLLRLALAEKALGAPQLAGHVALLQDRFDGSRARGDVVHRREEAIFELRLEGNPQAALALAAANWQVQHEPLDAQILLEAARAAREPQAARPAAQFLAEAHLESAQLRPLVQP